MILYLILNKISLAGVLLLSRHVSFWTLLHCTNHSKRNFQWPTAHNISILPQLISMNIGVIRNCFFLMTKQTNLPPNVHITPDALLCACSVYNIHRGVLGTSVNPETCRIRIRRANSIRIRYVWTRIFLDPQQNISGFKNIRIQKYPDTCGRGLKIIVCRL